MTDCIFRRRRVPTGSMLFKGFILSLVILNTVQFSLKCYENTAKVLPSGTIISKHENRPLFCSAISHSRPQILGKWLHLKVLSGHHNACPGSSTTSDYAIFIPQQSENPSNNLMFMCDPLSMMKLNGQVHKKQKVLSVTLLKYYI